MTHLEPVMIILQTIQLVFPAHHALLLHQQLLAVILQQKVAVIATVVTVALTTVLQVVQALVLVPAPRLAQVQVLAPNLHQVVKINY